jgi:hypothetical protein
MPSRRLARCRARGPEPRVGRLGCLGQLLDALHEGRVAEGQDLIGHRGGFHEVAERVQPRKWGERRTEARQEHPAEVALRVGDERIVLVGLHVLGLPVLPRRLVAQAAARPVDHLEAEEFEDRRRSNRGCLEIRTEVLVVSGERRRHLLRLVHRVASCQPRVLGHEEARPDRHRHARRFLQADGVDEELDARPVFLTHRVVRELDPRRVQPLLEATFATLFPAELDPAVVHRVVTAPAHLPSSSGPKPLRCRPLIFAWLHARGAREERPPAPRARSLPLDPLQRGHWGVKPSGGRRCTSPRSCT